MSSWIPPYCHVTPAELGRYKQRVCGKVSYKGFTLVEVLIVLVIISIIIAVAAVTFQGFGRGRKIKTETQHLARTLTLIQQKATLQPAILGLRVKKHGYQFYQLWKKQKNNNQKQKHSGWKKLTNGNLSQPNISDDIVFKLISIANNKTLKQGQGDAPSIVFLPDGSVTPFVLHISADNGDHLYIITAKRNGAITVTPPDAKKNNDKQ